MTESRKSVAAYLRVSTVEQEVGSQKMVVEHWLKEQGITPCAWYTDMESGKSLHRPAFAELQREVFSGRVSHVVMYSLDRFARNMLEGLVELDKWQQHHVRCTFVADGIDLDLGTWVGDVTLKIITAMKLAFAEAERRRISERVAAGVARAQMEDRQAREMRLAGKGLPQIARHFGVTVPQAEKMSHSSGRWGSGRSGRRKVVDMSLLRKLEASEQHYTASELARILNCCVASVWNARRELRKQTGKKIDRGLDEPARSGMVSGSCMETP